MAKLYFHYSTMNAGKSTMLLQVGHNYEERGMRPFFMTAKIDDRAGAGVIASRIGIKRDAAMFAADTNLHDVIKGEHAVRPIQCVLIDEAQFLSEEQVWQLVKVVNELSLPVMCYGLRTDFQGKLFPGSATLMALAQELREVRTICDCGKKATMVLRMDENGQPVKEGPQVAIGGNDTYRSVCLGHWYEAMGK